VSHTGDVPVCPTSGQETKPVSRKTVESLVKPEVRESLMPQPYYFCNVSDCDTVYVSAMGERVITKDMLTVRVGIKETEDPVPLCYCFGYDRKNIHNDIRQTGKTEIQRKITERIKDGQCRCEEMNPSGECCLGNVAKSIKNAIALKKQKRL
jgi:hypothetical protein